ncbi:MAG: ATP-binding protein [Acidimicrobiales bacterium]
MPTLSPYRPGFGQSPVVLAGRDKILTTAQRSLQAVVEAHRMDRPLALVGVRGVGKTALLKELADRAAAAVGAPRLRVEVIPGQPFLPTLVERAQVLARLVNDEPPVGRLSVSEAVLRAGFAGTGAEVHLSRQAPEVPDVYAALNQLSEALSRRGSAAVLTIDEAHAARRPELAVLGAALQEGTEQDWPLVVAFAALPSLRPRPSDSEREDQRGFTYFERARWMDVELLDDASTLLALSGPAASAGRPYEPAAAQELAAHTGGYPFAVQVYGEHAWWSSEGEAVISLAAVERSLPSANRDLDQGLYASRWAEASSRERDYLRALAALLRAGEPANGGAVARRLNETTKALSVYRDRLLNKGTLFVDDNGLLRFTVPGMAAYVLRQAGAEQPPIGGSYS